MKPFKSPLLARPPSESSSSTTIDVEPPYKRRRISVENHAKRNDKTPVAILRAAENLAPASERRTPLQPLTNLGGTPLPGSGREHDFESYYIVLWRKVSTKLHKTWDGDGYLLVRGGCAHLFDDAGKEMGRIAYDSPLLPGSCVSIGSKEIEVESVISKREYFAALSHVKSALPKPPPAKKETPILKSEIVPKPDKSKKATEKVRKQNAAPASVPSSKAIRGAWKNPMLSDTVMPKPVTSTAVPRHDPYAPGAIIFKRPKSVPSGKQIVDVVVDPILGNKLREHQREGVKFMYECVMGFRDFDGQGAILADEMGLGKSLQTIALLWTLLKQNPIADAPPIARKALIVCPVTLVNNWRKEITKWLGKERIGVFVADGTQKRITDFTLGRSYNVMIIGYEKLRNVQEELKKGPGIDIVIIDEGHRLKTAKNKSALAIKSLNTPRRVVLSGTPIQNDLSEFYIMVDFVNPDLLGSYKSFVKEYEVPIMKSRQPSASAKDIEKGGERNDELIHLTDQFILRRTADVLSGFLPPKTEYVLLCRPTSSQATLYHHILAHPAFQAALGNTECALQLITILKKACNSPTLLDPRLGAKAKADMTPSPLTMSLLDTIPPHLVRTNASSSKLRILDQLLHTIKTTTTEKVVLVSNYTSTLDVLSQLLTSLSYPFLRLDGSTPSSKRQDLVDTFNHSPVSSSFAFLLSAKAGGVGLNLIGASRLVLFDVDWNPATDLQAMARIHRDGQKRKCYIYRFLMKGAIDEKIWQRQITKVGLASSVMDQKSGGTASFTKEELRDLFRLDEERNCQTHELLKCECGGRGLPPGDEEVDPGFRDIDEIDSGGSKANDAKTLTTVPNLGEDSGSDSDFPSMPRLKPASAVEMAVQEAEIAASRRPTSKQQKMQHLMTYSHIDIGTFEDDKGLGSLEGVIEDEALLSVLRDEECRIGFVWGKTTT